MISFDSFVVKRTAFSLEAVERDVEGMSCDEITDKLILSKTHQRLLSKRFALVFYKCTREIVQDVLTQLNFSSQHVENLISRAFDPKTGVLEAEPNYCCNLYTKEEYWWYGGGAQGTINRSDRLLHQIQHYGN